MAAERALAAHYDARAVTTAVAAEVPASMPKPGGLVRPSALAAGQQPALAHPLDGEPLDLKIETVLVDPLAPLQP